MRQLGALGAAILSGASLFVLGAALAQQPDPAPAPADANAPPPSDVFADPAEPGEPLPDAPAPAAADVQNPSTAPTDPALAPGAPPASELDSLQTPATEGEDAEAEKPAVGLRRGQTVTLRALDKVTARYTDITLKIGEKKRFASLEILPRSCDKRPPEEFPETTAYLEIFDRDAGKSRTDATATIAPAASKKNAKEAPPPAKPLPPAQRQSHGDVAKGAPIDPDRIFSGWMFASSPGLSALDHPVYDVWVIDCSTASAAK
ncbi:MAG: DUF2155 domain-containing protein [Parvularculaceae bacterium]|nr:DUF2155 domain-containing protein [Parvularculaceae bacterium]